MTIQIGVVGDSECDERNRNIAEEVGREIGRKKCILICGGKGGIMEAACKGAQQVGGITVGILPGKSKAEANQHCTIQIVTGMGWTRNSIVALSADGIIAIGGKAGTLSEIAYSWMYSKPIVTIAGVGGWSERLAGQCIDNRRVQPIGIAGTPQQAVTMLLNWIDRGVK
ncbi:MAG: TIGR00725 family protein [Candidatus Ranarchaeia archaeon]